MGKEFLDLITQSLEVIETGTEILKSQDSPIPLVSFSLKVLGARDAYHTLRLKTNVLKFLESAQDHNTNWQELYTKVPVDKFTEFTNCLNLILIESEVEDKVIYSGRLLHALIHQRISYQQFYSFCLIINSSSLPALKALADSNYSDKERIHISSESSALAASTGLAVMHTFADSKGGVGANLTDSGVLFTHICHRLTGEGFSTILKDSYCDY